MGLLPALANAQICRKWSEAVRAGELTVQLEEASGVVASRHFPGRLYFINDSGDSGFIYMTGMNGSNPRPIRVAGFNPTDTEALSLGPCPGRRGASCLYIGDIGDNGRRRRSIEIAVIAEMKDFTQTVTARNRLSFRYPDGPHDAEGMAVHPDGTIFILTKERPGKLFKTNRDAKQTTLVEVRTMDADITPTDLAISDDGTRMLVLTYADAYEYSLDFKQQQKIGITFLQQQESVTYLPGSRSFIYTTERLLPILPQFIMRMDCLEPK